DETEHWVVGVPEAGLEPFVPRVTLTFPALASTREMLFLVSGAGKRDVLGRVLAGADLPAAHAYAEGDLVFIVEQDAMPALSAASADVLPAPLGSGQAGAAASRRPAPGARALQPESLPSGARHAPAPVPAVIVVMGVSGSGKSTVAAMLAHR